MTNDTNNGRGTNVKPLPHKPYKTSERLLEAVSQLIDSPGPTDNENAVGVYLGAILEYKLAGVDTSNMADINKAVYSALGLIVRDMSEGDWLTFPDGSEFTLTHKVPIK